MSSKGSDDEMLDIDEDVSMGENTDEAIDDTMDDMPAPDEEEYDFEYEEDIDDEEESDIQIENLYYQSKGDLDEEVDKAKKGFEQVLKMEKEKGKWFVVG